MVFLVGGSTFSHRATPPLSWTTSHSLEASRSAAGMRSVVPAMMTASMPALSSSSSSWWTK